MVILQVILVAVFVFGLMVLSARAQEAKSSQGDAPPSVTAERVQGMSREDIRRALTKIETNTPPPRKMGAMCYDMVGPSDMFEYVCPIDGEKTVYARNAPAFGQATELQSVRELINRLRPLTGRIAVTLDERRLCSRCEPAVTDQERYVSLLLKYPDGEVVRTDRVTTEDIRYLIGFFSAGLSYPTFTDGQEPLKSVEGRLKQLLGE